MPSQRSTGTATISAHPMTAAIAKARVLQEPIGGSMVVQLLSSTNAIIGQRTVSFLKGQRPPAVDAIGLVVYSPSGGTANACWIGEEYVPADTVANQIDSGTSADEIFFHNDDSTAILKVSRSLVNIANQYFELTGNSAHFTLRSNSKTITLNDNFFEVFAQTYHLKLGANPVIQTTALLPIVGSQGLQLITPSDLVISSGLTNPSGATILQQHGAINNFILKANDARIAIGGMTVIDTSALTVNLTSRRLLDPGNSTTFRLSVTQGNAIITLGTGDLDLNVLGPISFASLCAGSLTTGIYSRVKVTRLGGEFRNFTAGVLSEVKVGPAGKLNISADTTLDMSAEVSFSLTSTATGSISANATLDVSAMAALTLESDINVEINALFLKFDKSSFISLGTPRVASPNPSLSGGWCAIPMCPFAQIPHCGDTLIGGTK